MDEYKYRGVELTPRIFTELLILHFDGKQFKREEAPGSEWYLTSPEKVENIYTMIIEQNT